MPRSSQLATRRRGSSLVHSPQVGGGSSLELAPLNTLLARRLIARTRVSRLLRVYRGEGAPNIETVVELLIRLGLLAADHPEIRQLEINSLLVDADGTRALDARLRIAPAQSTEG